MYSIQKYRAPLDTPWRSFKKLCPVKWGNPSMKGLCQRRIFGWSRIAGNMCKQIWLPLAWDFLSGKFIIELCTYKHSAFCLLLHYYRFRTTKAETNNVLSNIYCLSSSESIDKNSSIWVTFSQKKRVIAIRLIELSSKTHFSSPF